MGADNTFGETSFNPGLPMRTGICTRCGATVEFYSFLIHKHPIIVEDLICTRPFPHRKSGICGGALMLKDSIFVSKCTEDKHIPGCGCDKGTKREIEYLEEDHKTLKLESIRREAKPCPFCGGKNLFFTYSMSYGQGDCGFEGARIICRNCYGSKGNGFGYGKPTDLDEIRAYCEWNKRH